MSDLDSTFNRLGDQTNSDIEFVFNGRTATETDTGESEIHSSAFADGETDVDMTEATSATGKSTDSTENDSIVELPVVKPVPPVHDVDSETSEKQGNSSISTEKIYQSFQSGEQMSLKMMSECSMVMNEADTVILSDSSDDKTETQQKIKDAVPSAGTDKTVAEPENKIEDADKKKAQSENQQKMEDAVPSAGTDKTINKTVGEPEKKAQSENQQKIEDAVPSAGTDKTVTEPENKIEDADKKKAQSENQQKMEDAVPSAGTDKTTDKTVSEPEKKAQSENQQKIEDAVPSAVPSASTNKTVAEDEKKAQTDGAEEETIDNPQKSVATESTGLLTGNNDIVSPATTESTVLETGPQVKVETSVVTESAGPQVKVETSTGLKASTGTSSPRSEYEDVFGPQVNL